MTRRKINWCRTLADAAFFGIGTYLLIKIGGSAALYGAAATVVAVEFWRLFWDPY
jgi:hypothetical protein